jgi:DNA-binding cell septation regulator SpoVG
MFSYDVKVRKINSTSNLKAFVTLVVEGVLEIDGFKVINGKNGLFVSVPSHKGTVMEDGQKVEKYFDDVRFVGEPGIEFSNELKSAILDAYNSSSSSPKTSSPSQSDAVKAKNTAQKQENPSSSEGPSRTRKPLWGF